MRILLDTSVLIHDPNCVFKFSDEYSILIPIYVIMELDVLKDKDKNNVAYLARKASNNILKLMKDKNIKIISCEDQLSIKTLDNAHDVRYVDLLILQTAINELKSSDEDLKLLTKDVNLRIISKSMGVCSEDYTNTEVEENNVYKGIREIVISERLMSRLHKSYWQGLVHLTEDEYVDLSCKENEYVHYTDMNNKTHLFQFVENGLKAVDKVRTDKVKPRNVEQRASLDLLLNSDIQLVCLLGKAGTGKTFLALASAIAQSNLYTKILLSKPVVDIGRGIGFLPGSMSEKLEPWMQSFFDNLDQIEPTWDMIEDQSTLLEKMNIEIQPIHSIRGRSLKNAFMIIDEAQNLTKHEIKTIITRSAEGTKVVLLGDPYQIDHPYLSEKDNGLVYVIEKFKNKSIFGCVSLTKSERSKLSDLASDLL